MKNKGWLRIGLGLVVVPIILIAGFVAMIISSLSGGDRFYTPLIMAATILLCAVVIVGIGGWLKRRIYWIVVACLLLAGSGAIGGYEINRAYHNSFAKLSDDGVKLALYEPFAPGTKAAKLEERVTLSLREPLPVMDGATALYPLYSAFAQAVYPEQRYNYYDSEVRSTTTPMAYKSVVNGEADIIFAAAPSREQEAEASASGSELKLTPIGMEAFVFFVNRSNPVTNITTEQVKSIYSGEITNWSQIGGDNTAIRAFQRPEGSGSQSALLRLMEGEPLMAPPKEDVVAGMGGIIEQTADYRNYRNAIGYSFLFYATEMVDNGEIRLLSIDGVAPSRETIQNGTYPLSSTFFAVTAGTDNANVEPLIEWILSEQGQTLVEKTGYTPIAQP